jgi:intracellular multiplication protein IcmD
MSSADSFGYLAFFILNSRKEQIMLNSYSRLRNTFLAIAPMYLGIINLGHAAAVGVEDVGYVSTEITESFGRVADLITAVSYVAGLAFFIGAIMKFKQHKDNPTQIPVGTPIALVFIATALLFLPSILGVTGSTIFGPGEAKTSGPTGSVYKSD